MNGLFLGVDVGLSGAIGAVDGNGRLALVEDLPVLARGKGRVKRELDAAALARLLRPHAPDVQLVVVEAVAARPGQGVASMFSLGHSLGVVVGVVQALMLPVLLVTAQSWKRQLGVPADKGLARAFAARRWPDAALGRVRDHNRGEALLLADYGRRRGT
jgi:crossover junction endodeoxyribonuclease RuvC